MGCGITIIKYLMFFFNLLIFLSGAALLGLAIWVLVDGESFRRVISTDPAIFNSVYIIVVVGAALFFIGFLGCCGAVKENRCLLGTFFATILAIFLLQLIGAILAVAMRSRAEKLAKEELKNSANETRQAWNDIQIQGECCGMDGPGDWGEVPDSCCAPDSSVSSCNASTAYPIGCKEKINKMFLILGGISIGILFVEILAMIFSCLLYREVGKDSS